MHFLTSHLEWLGRWLLMFTNNVTVESPEAMVNIMKELTEEIRNHFLPEETLQR
jgi:hemerythrin